MSLISPPLKVPFMINTNITVKVLWFSYLDCTFWLHVEKFVAGGSLVVVIPPLISDVK